MDNIDVNFTQGIERISVTSTRGKEGLPAQSSRLTPARSSVVSHTANQFPDKSLQRQLLDYLSPDIADSTRLVPVNYAHSRTKARECLKEAAARAASPAKCKRLNAGLRLLDREKENHDLLDMLRQALLRS